MFTKVWNALLACLVAIAAFLAIAFGGGPLLGLTPYAVLSGSMEPELPVGSLIYGESSLRVQQDITRWPPRHDL